MAIAFVHVDATDAHEAQVADDLGPDAAGADDGDDQPCQWMLTKRGGVAHPWPCGKYGLTGTLQRISSTLTQAEYCVKSDPVPQVPRLRLDVVSAAELPPIWIHSPRRPDTVVTTLPVVTVG